MGSYLGNLTVLVDLMACIKISIKGDFNGGRGGGVDQYRSKMCFRCNAADYIKMLYTYVQGIKMQVI